MIGLIAKILGFFGGLILIGLIILNITNVWNPGTVSLLPPDRSACERYAATNYEGQSIELMEVRWIFTEKDYGWGCYYEFGDFNVKTVTPMPR